MILQSTMFGAILFILYAMFGLPSIGCGSKEKAILSAAKSGLRDLADAEAAQYAAHRTFTVAPVEDKGKVRFSAGNRVTIVLADSTTLLAEATNPGMSYVARLRMDVVNGTPQVTSLESTFR